MVDMNDLVGTRVGGLQVLEYLGRIQPEGQKTVRPWYRCKCDCGNECMYRRDHLIEQRVSTCGHCFKIVREGDHYRYICASGESFIFDYEDYNAIERYQWHIVNRVDGYGYVARRSGKNYIYLTHDLLGVSSETFVDHVNGDTLDERRTNLRIASVHENTCNQKLRKDSSSGYKGVHYIQRRRKYEATIQSNHKKYHLGYFDNPEDGARAYDEAARFYFGEFACVNFPLPGEQGCRRNEEREALSA